MWEREKTNQEQLWGMYQNSKYQPLLETYGRDYKGILIKIWKTKSAPEHCEQFSSNFIKNIKILANLENQEFRPDLAWMLKKERTQDDFIAKFSKHSNQQSSQRDKLSSAQSHTTRQHNKSKASHSTKQSSQRNKPSSTQSRTTRQHSTSKARQSAKQSSQRNKPLSTQSHTTRPHNKSKARHSASQGSPTRNTIKGIVAHMFQPKIIPKPRKFTLSAFFSLKGRSSPIGNSWSRPPQEKHFSRSHTSRNRRGSYHTHAYTKSSLR